MSRRVRIAIELLGPPLVAAVLYLGVHAVRDPRVAKYLPFYVFFAYLYAAVPSVAFTVVMEISFAKGLEARSGRTVLVASGLGLLAGIAVAVLLAEGFDNQHNIFTVIPALGLVTGAIIGVVVGVLSPKNALPQARA